MDKFHILKNKSGNLLTGLLTKEAYINNDIIQQSIKQLIVDTLFYTDYGSNHLSVRNYIIKNNIKENDLVCKRIECEQQVKFRTLKKGFSDFCSQRCTNLDKDVQNKRKMTLLKNYGVEHALQNIDLNKKMKDSYNKTINLMYNNQHVFNQHLTNYDYWFDKDFIIKNFIDEKEHFKLSEFKMFFNCQQTAANRKLVDLDIKYVKRTGVSLVEYELIDWLEDCDISNIIKNSRTIISSELDIFIPDLNIAIEFNGNYWHSYCSELSKNVSNKQSDLNYQMFHKQEKSIECLHKNIQLFHMDENNIDDIKHLILLYLTHEPLEPTDNEVIVDLLIDNGNWLKKLGYSILSINDPEFIIENGRTIYDAGTITYSKNNNIKA
jgi:hypothetical protein